MGRQFVYSGILGVSVLLGLILALNYSFLLFHSLAEGFSIVIACGIFMLAWNTRRFLENNYLLFAGIAYLFIGGLDLVHTLSYKGMGVLHGYNANTSAQLWIAARYLESLSLGLAPLWVDRKLSAKPVFGVFAAIFTILLAAIFYGGIFPDCFIEGTGLTPFKIISEYIISLILMAGLAFLFIKRRFFERAVLRLLILSIILTIASEIAFTFYVSVYGLSNQIGHYLKITSFFLIYKAIIHTGLVRPYDLLFRDLKQSRERLQAAHDQLEQRVWERTAELLAVTDQLHAEITERQEIQKELLKANQMLKTLSECNQCLVRATDENAFLDTMCRSIIDHGGYRIAWVGVVAQNQGPSLRPLAQAGCDNEFLEALQMLELKSDAPDDPIAAVFRTGRPRVVRDIRPGNDLPVWLSATANSGIVSAIILPLGNNGDTLGVLQVYSDQPEAFDSRQIELLMELAKDAAFGISTIRMRQQRLLLSTAVEQAGECIAIADSDAIIKYANPALERIIGSEPHAFIGRPLADLLEGNDTVPVDTILHGVKTGKPWNGRIKGKSAQGAVLDLNIALSPVRDPSQKILNLVAIIRDITRECRMERQLIQSQKMEAIGTLAGGIAHDFNNILSAINGFTELVLDEVEKDTIAYANLSEVLKAGHRAKELVQQILAFSRQTMPEYKPVIVKHIVKETAKLLRSSLPATIEIRQNLNSEGRVMADPTQIHQVVMNLGANAAHAMRENGGLLEFDLTDDFVEADRCPGLQPGPFVKLTINDTGHGMPQEIMDHIFEPFFTTKENSEGTGMGLSVVHGIVHDCGGMVTVSSEPGKGSGFSVFLPAVGHKTETRGAEELSIPLGTEEQILFVDDEPSLANMGRQVLESLGYQATTRTDGSEALNLIKAQPNRFDLVIMDMTMPKITGDKLAQAIMAIQPKLPVILCSGFSTRMDEHKAAALGIQAYIRKPILREQLARIIREILDKKSSGDTISKNMHSRFS